MKIPALGTTRLSRGELLKRAARIRLVVLDVDGVLTDGGMYYSPQGEVLKRFDTRDGHGIACALKAGLEVAFLTREATSYAKARAEKLKVRHCILGALDKPAELETLQKGLRIAPAETAYVGDDVFDLPCAPLAALFFTTPDGFLLDDKRVHVVTERGGGRGAVRQVMDYLLGARRTLKPGASPR